MLSKKYVLRVPDLEKIRKGQKEAVSVKVKLDDADRDALIEAGYHPTAIKSETQYKYPKSWQGDASLYVFLLLQDLAKGRMFNSLRYPCFCLIKHSVFGQELTPKQKVALESLSVPKRIEENLTQASPPEETVVEEENKPIREKIVIAFTASAPQIGKTQTSIRLAKYLQETTDYSVTSYTIAEYIRDILASVATFLDKDASRFFENYDQKDVVRTFENESIPFKTRDLLCDFSILMQKYYGTNIWGQTAISNISEFNEDIIVIDDLRRPDEYDILRKQYGENLITVYLDKVDVENKQRNENLSEAAQAFEAKLKKEDMDLSFTFNEDWSNIDELFEKIKTKLV